MNMSEVLKIEDLSGKIRRVQLDGIDWDDVSIQLVDACQATLDALAMHMRNEMDRDEAGKGGGT